MSEEADARLIAEGHDPECVRYVCAEHNRHCTWLGQDHAQHECVWCAGARRRA